MVILQQVTKNQGTKTSGAFNVSLIDGDYCAQEMA